MPTIPSIRKRCHKSNLPVVTKTSTRAVIIPEHKSEKNITLLISHNMNDIAALSDKVLVMEKGQVAMMGTPREVFSRGPELKEMGLALPPAAEFMNRMREKGCPAEASVLTKEEALEALLLRLKVNREQVAQ